MEMNQTGQSYESCNEGSKESVSFAFYSGTILQNLKTCLYKEKGKIIFDKRLEPMHENSEIYFTSDFNIAAFYGIRTATKTSMGNPVVMCGCPLDEIFPDSRMNNDQVYTSRNGKFEVIEVWLPRIKLINPDLATILSLDKGNMQKEFKKGNIESLERMAAVLI
jgi:hypothetical protein